MVISSSSNDNTATIISSDTDMDHFVLAAQLIQSSTLPMVLHAALELGVFDIIAAAGPGHKLSAEAIVAHLPITAIGNPDAVSMVDRMLHLLATYSVLTCSFDHTSSNNNGRLERLYGLSPMSKFFVPDETGASLGPLLALFVDPVIQGSWSKLKEAVLKGGIPFNMVHGVNAFEYPRLDTRFNQVFNKAMFNYPCIIIKNILQKYKGFEGIKQLVDVGGGLGHNLHAITSKYPSTRGINFDLPHVIRDALPFPGVEHVSGDMFETIPRGDAIFMKWVLQVWSNGHCLKVLKNCYKAIPADGKVIVVESIVKPEPETTVIAKAISQMDVYMMTKNPGGKERTQEEFLALATSAGFNRIIVQCQVGQLWVMEFYK